MHRLHLHLGAGKCLFNGMILLVLHCLHLLQHLTMGSLQLSLVHHDLGEEQVGDDTECPRAATPYYLASTRQAENVGGALIYTYHTQT